MIGGRLLPGPPHHQLTIANDYLQTLDLHGFLLQMKTDKLPPRSIAELEGIDSRWQFSLGKLIIATNLIGAAIAMIAKSGGYAFFTAALIGFLSPMIVFVYISACLLKDRFYTNPKTDELNAPTD